MIASLGALLHVTSGAFLPWAVPALLTATLLWWLLVVGSPAVVSDSWALLALAALVLIAEAAIVARSPHIYYPQAPVRLLVLTHLLKAFTLAAVGLGAWS
ncbi:MAG TPA: hypothetical protein VMF89_16510, partial [Polyangiales bacterium]|nr:hypothetical protein [Polyangiales bacterium]